MEDAQDYGIVNVIVEMNVIFSINIYNVVILTLVGVLIQ